jgi:hypothetical protein
MQHPGDLVFTSAAGVKMLYLNSPEVVHDLLDKQASITSDRHEVPMLELLGLIIYFTSGNRNINYYDLILRTNWDFNFAFMKYGERWRTHNRIFHKARRVFLFLFLSSSSYKIFSTLIYQRRQATIQH